MKLPNNKNLIVSKEKLTEYILSGTHPAGKFKAKFFQSVGFNKRNVNLFEKLLRQLAQSENVTEVLPSIFGTKYIIEAKVKTPKGKFIKIRSIWIIEEGQYRPRFVTVYPV